MSDCPYTGKTLLEKRELPLLPPTLDKDEIPGASHQAVSQTEERSGATASASENQSDQRKEQEERELPTLGQVKFRIKLWEEKAENAAAASSNN